MGKKILKVSALLLAVLLPISCAASGVGYRRYNTAHQPYDTAVEQVAAQYDVPAAQAVYMKSGKILRLGVCGNGTKEQSLFCIGSISKSFVAALALLLQQEGKLSLQDTVGQYLPAMRIYAQSKATLRELLSMRSGIADYMADFDQEDYFKSYQRDFLIRKGLSASSLFSGGDFRYTNTNILIAEEMIEKATGESCEKLIRQKILQPLGLDDTFFADEKPLIRSRLISGYSVTRISEKVDFTDATTSWADLACGMYSTAANMAHWAYALTDSPLLSKASKAEMQHFQPVSGDTEYGLCLIRKTIGEEQFMELLGNVPGYGAAVLIHQNEVYVVLCDLSDYSGGNASYAELMANTLISK